MSTTTAPTAFQICSLALDWVGKDFAKGQSAQCANFVRAVFLQGGYKLPEAAHPSDLDLNPGMPLGASYADSLAGDEIGAKVARKDVRAGDIVIFKNTYDSGYAVDTETHVGIALSNSEMVDRSTSSHPVLRRPIDTFVGSSGQFAEARRPKLFASTVTPAPPAPPAPHDIPVVLKVFAHDGKSSGLLGIVSQPTGTLVLGWGDTGLQAVFNGEKLSPVSLELLLKFDSAPTATHAPPPIPTTPKGSSPKPAGSSARIMEDWFTTLNSPLVIAIGLCEGTRTIDGSHTSAWAGHVDPGNGARNQGTFSYQGPAFGPNEADSIWLFEMNMSVPKYEQACALGKINPANARLCFSCFDLFTQAPDAVLLEGGFLDQIPHLGAAPTRDQLVEARVRSFYDPASGRLQASGFGNDVDRLRADQARRTDCILAAIAYYKL